MGKEKFEEEKRYKIPGEFLGKKPIIYILYYNNKIVYIGESMRGIKRTMSHLTTKVFDEFSFFDAPEDRIERLELEKKLILKHRPVYNGPVSLKSEMREKGYINIDDIRDRIRIKYQEDSYRITRSFLSGVKNNCRTELVGKILYAYYDDVSDFILKKFGIDINN